MLLVAVHLISAYMINICLYQLVLYVISLIYLFPWMDKQVELSLPASRALVLGRLSL